jgi:hypothetical protein
MKRLTETMVLRGSTACCAWPRSRRRCCHPRGSARPRAARAPLSSLRHHGSRCAPWRPANWSCRGRCRPRAGAGGARRLAGLGNLQQGHENSGYWLDQFARLSVFVQRASASSISNKSFSRNISRRTRSAAAHSHFDRPAARQLARSARSCAARAAMVQMLEFVMIAGLRASITASRHSICSIRKSAASRCCFRPCLTSWPDSESRYWPRPAAFSASGRPHWPALPTASTAAARLRRHARSDPDEPAPAYRDNAESSAPNRAGSARQSEEPNRSALKSIARRSKSGALIRR